MDPQFTAKYRAWLCEKARQHWLHWQHRCPRHHPSRRPRRQLAGLARPCDSPLFEVLIGLLQHASRTAAPLPSSDQPIVAYLLFPQFEPRVVSAVYMPSNLLGPTCTGVSQMFMRSALTYYCDACCCVCICFAHAGRELHSCLHASTILLPLNLGGFSFSNPTHQGL